MGLQTNLERRERRRVQKLPMTRKDAGPRLVCKLREALPQSLKRHKTKQKNSLLLHYYYTITTLLLH